MARRLRPVGLDFVESAPVRLVFSAETAAAPENLYRALAEDVPGWSAWFSAVTSARPIAEGAGREIRLVGGGRFLEAVLAARPCEVYAYRVDVTNAPGARAIAEEWRLAPAGTGTRVRWTFAADGTAPFRGVVRLGGPALGRAFRDAVAALDRRLAVR
ncbi:SRPBCC family protein [Streptomyces flaveolus]|uniref:SRPBCC family protein n=1 Tax=Streptomyces flaveolus TaxID=67297 RepID=UPI001670CCA7|nr:SRPBCC family protein [Streptomyces flaveolus]GGQ72935.1 polyketide cyclase [Streptomyces flaveolus]